MAKVCSLCKATVDAVPGEACPACEKPFVEISIEERAQLLVAKMRAEMAAKAAAKAAAAAAAVVEPPPPASGAENPIVETAPPAVDEPVFETAPPAVDEPVVETAPPAVDEPVVETAPPAVDEPIVETAPPAVDEPVVDDAPTTQPEPAPEDAARAATASPTLPKEFRSERIRLKPVVPKPEPPPPPPDPNLPRERVPLPAFVPLVPGKPAPPPPSAESKAKAAKVRSTALRASLLFLLLAAIGFGAWQGNLLPIPGGAPSATPAVASPVPSNTVVAIVSTAKSLTLAPSPAATAAPSPVIAPVTPVTSALASPEIAPVTPVPHATAKPVVDPKAEALASAGAHFDRGEFDEAAIALHAILLDHDDFAEAHAMLGATLARQGDVAGACDEYARYLQLATNGTLVEQVRRASASCPR